MFEATLFVIRGITFPLDILIIYQSGGIVWGLNNFTNQKLRIEKQCGESAGPRTVYLN
jgi:hypothetical protein